MSTPFLSHSSNHWGCCVAQYQLTNSKPRIKEWQWCFLSFVSLTACHCKWTLIGWLYWHGENDFSQNLVHASDLQEDESSRDSHAFTEAGGLAWNQRVFLLPYCGQSCWPVILALLIKWILIISVHLPVNTCQCSSVQTWHISSIPFT